jgi:hypothetical protein
MKRLGYVSLITLVLTVTWLALLIASMAGAGPLDTFDRVLAYAARGDALFYLSYINSALIVVPAAMLFCELYRRYREMVPYGALVGLIFVPVYAALNLFAYLSQITVVPGLVALRQQPEYQAAADVLLRQTIQSWPESGVAFFNGLAYAVLGIPSIVFGLLMFRHTPPLKLAGVLLALNGAACILGVIGFLTRSDLLGMGTVAGGILFLLALVPMSRLAFLGTR